MISLTSANSLRQVSPRHFARRLLQLAALALFGAGAQLGCAHDSPAADREHAAANPPDANSNAPVSAASDDAALALGRRWTAAFYARETQAMWDQFTGEMQKALGNKAALDAFREQIEQLGSETQLVSERVEHKGGNTLYRREAVFAHSPSPFLVAIVFDAQGRIPGFVIKPAGKLEAAATDKENYVTKTPLRLPFQGAWSVAWGGHTLEQNQHAVTRDQRFAYDLLIVKHDSTHQGEGKQNSDYFCEGQTIFAPGAGRVVEATDGIAENVPGQMNALQPMGNHVIIDHGNGEFSFLAHFQTGSVLVKSGDAVAVGQPLARCGNSGHSSEPHLHYHLQNSGKFGAGEGLPAQFEDYQADGAAVQRGEPVRGQLIESNRH